MYEYRCWHTPFHFNVIINSFVDYCLNRHYDDHSTCELAVQKYTCLQAVIIAVQPESRLLHLLAELTGSSCCRNLVIASDSSDRSEAPVVELQARPTAQALAGCHVGEH
jgi:hypothetical protein